MGPLCVGKAQRPINAPRPYILTDFQSVFATSSIHNTSACTDSDRNKEEFLIPSFIPKRNIPHVHVRKVCDGVFVSQVSDLSLSGYVAMQSKLCAITHRQPCLNCPPLLY